MRNVFCFVAFRVCEILNFMGSCFSDATCANDRSRNDPPGGPIKCKSYLLGGPDVALRSGSTTKRGTPSTN